MFLNCTGKSSQKLNSLHWLFEGYFHTKFYSLWLSSSHGTFSLCGCSRQFSALFCSHPISLSMEWPNDKRNLGRRGPDTKEVWPEHQEAIINFAFYFLPFPIFYIPEIVMWKLISYFPSSSIGKRIFVPGLKTQRQLGCVGTPEDSGLQGLIPESKRVFC